MIGDLHTVALVGNEGTIDWFCPERFDAPSMFGAILDSEQGGRFSIRPADAAFTTKQLYLPGTAVLVTRFFTESGVGEVVDFMPLGPSALLDRAPHRGRARIARLPRLLQARVRLRAHAAPADRRRRARDLPRGRPVVRAARAQRDARGRGRRRASPRSRSGAASARRSCCRRAARRSGTRRATEAAFDDTVQFWRDWIAQSRYRGRWREFVDRSAITLKLLTYLPTGAVVAAPTTSLPEHLGGPRNWDYRYCWLRDSAFTMFAFLRLGFRDEAAAYLNWLHERGNVRQGGRAAAGHVRASTAAAT